MRILGFEIKRLATEPAVQGRAETLAKVKGRAWPWWHPYGLTGRLAVAGALAAIIAAIFFPVFAQSKAAARRGDDTVSSPAWEGETQFGYVGSGAAAEDAKMPFEGGLAENERTARAPATLPAPSKAKGAAGERGRQAQTPSQPRPDIGVVPIPRDKRMVIQNADMARRVDDVERAREEAEAMTKGFGGYVESSSISGEKDRNPVANLILRIPNTRFDAAMKRLRDMGEKISENVTGTDVTKEYADIEGNLKVLRAEADSYLTMLRAARKVGELIEIKDRLAQVRQQIASYEQQRLALKDLSTLSTISVRFEQKPKVGEPVDNGSPIQEAWVSAVNGLKAVGTFLVQTVIFIFVFAPVWIPPVVLFWWLGKKAKA